VSKFSTLETPFKTLFIRISERALRESNVKESLFGNKFLRESYGIALQDLRRVMERMDPKLENGSLREMPPSKASLSASRPPLELKLLLSSPIRKKKSFKLFHSHPREREAQSS
jgi:hypothetical protein